MEKELSNVNTFMKIKNKILEKNLSIPDILSLASTLGDNFRSNFSIDELKSAAELTGRELGKWVALARNFGCFSQIELYMMVESMKNQVDFLCKNRNPADPQYVDEWFRFKKMF